jgi:Protein of unknown function (DUF1203)
MIGYKIITLPTTVITHVHTTLTDPIYHHPAPVTIAGEGDYGPCRLCLNTFSLGERRILFLYNPFSTQQDADFAGPIFIHADRCLPYTTPQLFPEPIRCLPITLRGYTTHNHFIAEEHPHSLNVEIAIETLLRRPDVAFIHVRNTEAKCFILRMERS